MAFLSGNAGSRYHESSDRLQVPGGFLAASGGIYEAGSAPVEPGAGRQATKPENPKLC